MAAQKDRKTNIDNGAKEGSEPGVVTPPKSKSPSVGRPRKSTKGKSPALSIKTKAKRSVKRNLKVKKDNVEKARDKLESAKKSYTGAKENIAKFDNSESNIVTPDDISRLPPSVQEYVKDQDVIFVPNDGPQTDFLAAGEREVFYGGARGGGKSYAMLVDPLRYCHKPMHRALLIRRTMPELRDMINHSLKLYSKAFPGAKWREQEKEWRFPSGARVEFGYAESLGDALRYQGQSYTWIGIDELPQYPSPEVYNFLRSSLRSVDPEIPVYLRATGNPGNIGSHWVKEMFVDPEDPGEPFEVTIETPVGVKSISRRFIPAKLQDNPYLMQTDDYLIMLASLPEIQRRQFLEGDWNAFDSAAFPEFNKDVHVVAPFEIPNTWVRFRTCDWGYSSPACVLWIAVDYDDTLWVYRELYVTRLTADDFANTVLSMEEGEYISYGVLDSSTWAKRGDIGPSIAESMIREGCKWRPSDRSPKSRVSGKLEIHKRLSVNSETNVPGMKVFSSCRNLIRTLPALPLDDRNPEDVDTKAEDHAYDALRYGCMSRPIGPSYYSDISRNVRQVFVPGNETFGY